MVSHPAPSCAPTTSLRSGRIGCRFTVVRGAERVRVANQVCGSQWVPSVLGAIGGGLAVGLTLDECAAGIARVAPFEGRMQPVTTPDGVTFIRDDCKAPLWTLDACFDFMRAARARRKIIVIGTLSDCGAGAPKKYVKVARRAQEIADITVFVGPWASQRAQGTQARTTGALRISAMSEMPPSTSIRLLAKAIWSC